MPTKTKSLPRLRIREIVEEKDTNLYQIAKAAGKPQSYLYSFMKPDSNPKLDSLLELASLLGVSLDELVRKPKKASKKSA